MENQGPPVDGITASEGQTPDQPTAESTPKKKADDGALSRARFAIIIMIGMPYTLYLGWCFFLLTVLPDPQGTWEILIPYARLLSMIVSVVLLLGGLFAFVRIGKSHAASDKVRYGGFARMLLVVLPGLIMSGFVPYWISKEPPLSLRITNPPAGTEFVAPMAISFSAEEAVAILKRRNLSVKSFQWDYTGDGLFNEETVTPNGTAYFDRQGGYNVSATLNLSDGDIRTLWLRVVIPNAVFSYTPFVPVVDEPVKFSVAHLVPDKRDAEVREVQWDFDQDGIPDESTTSLETTHTFLRTGLHTVTVVIFLSNQTQNTYVRTINISKPKPNPFPVTIETTPEFLESPPPFQVVFRLSTEEPLQEVKWDFDDGSPEETGERVGHTFSNRKVYQVKAYARNLEGQISKATKIVKLVERLNIQDLGFDGSHNVEGGQRIVAEAPVAITLTPKTTIPLIDFWWDAPGATNVTSTETTLKAIYRKQGTYTLVLLAKDAEGRVLRKPIVLEVKPKSKFVTFDVSPTQGIAPGDLVVFDASKSRIPGEQITGFAWNFGDEDEQALSYGDAIQEHRYERPGEYAVTLTVNTLSGRNEVATQAVLVRAPFLKACFTMSRNKGRAPFGVLFSWKCTTGTPTSVLWRYGDGAEAESNPGDGNVKKEEDHVFTEPGIYDVELILKDENGAESIYTLPVTVE